MIKPCPFCGAKPNFPEVGEVFGTCYDAGCENCGLASLSFQISDSMTIEERLSDPFTNYKYQDEYIERVRNEAIEAWNTRAAQEE
jgi:hypothetical protein